MDTVIPNAQATFIRGSAVQPFEQELNMKDGNQVVESNGAFFKSATIIKPETLIPENIKKGIDIGGVEGTFEIQGVSKSANIDFATEYFKSYSSTDTKNFPKAENEGKYIRIMYDPFDGLFGETVKKYAYYRCDASGSSYVLTEVSADEIPLLDNQIINADEGTTLTSVILQKPETLISENIRKNTDIGGVTGSFIGNGYSQTLTNLNFSEGVVTVTPEKDKLFNEVKIAVPQNLEAKNIKNGVVIAGIQGTYTSDGLPTLYAPTAISNLTNYNSTSYPLTSNNTGAYITVTNPTSSNGNFVTECQLYVTEEKDITNEDGSVTKETVETMVARKTGSSSTFYFYANDWLIEDCLYKADTLKAQFLGNYFKPSNKYVKTGLTTVAGSNTYGGIGITPFNYEIENATMQYTPQKTYWGQYITNKFIPKSNYYLPKKISITLDGTIYGSDYDMISNGKATYNNTTGAITINYYRLNSTYTDAMQGQMINIRGIAPNIPWLKDFTTLPSITDNILTIPRPDKNAERADLWLNGNTIYSVNFPELRSKMWTVTSKGSYRTSISSSNTAGVEKDNKTTYTFRSSGSSSGYAVYRYTFTCTEATKININWTQYGYSSSSCGYISTLDCNTFATSYSTETNSECLFYGPNYSNNTYSGTIPVTIPAGTHTIDVKWKGYYSSTSYYFSVGIDYASSPTNLTINLTEVPAFNTSGDYSFQVTGEAEGYTGTDPVTLEYERIAVSVEDETLIVDSGIVENEVLTTDLPRVSEETLIYNA